MDGLVHHPGQLAAADDADHRIHGESLLAPRDRHAAWAIHGRRVTTVGANRYESGSEPLRGRQQLDRPDRLQASWGRRPSSVPLVAHRPWGATTKPALPAEEERAPSRRAAMPKYRKRKCHNANCRTKDCLGGL